MQEVVELVELLAPKKLVWVHLSSAAEDWERALRLYEDVSCCVRFFGCAEVFGLQSMTRQNLNPGESRLMGMVITVERRIHMVITVEQQRGMPSHRCYDSLCACRVVALHTCIRANAL